MATTMLKYTQFIRGFQHQKHEYSEEKVIWHIRRKTFQCPRCGSFKLRKEVKRI